MDKKFIKLFVISIAFISSLFMIGSITFNQSGMFESTLDEINEKRGIASINVKNVLIGDGELETSKTYVQHAKDETTGAYYLRFATAIKGDISSASYTRKVLDSSIEDKSFEVTTVYSSIFADGKELYYDGINQTTSEDVTFAGDYYWACYTVKFSQESVNKAKDLEVSLSINDTKVSTRTSSLYDSVVSEYETIKEEFNLMSFNIRQSGASDSGNKNWNNRKNAVCEYILNSGMDVICFQEVTHNQYVDVKSGVNEKYDVVWEGRQTGNNGLTEGLMIAYSNTFELINLDMFWLCANPDEMSKDWGTYVDENGNTVDYKDDEYYRICVNALLRSNKGVYLDVYNAHLGLTDDSSALAADLIIDRMSKSNYPSVVMGDFNVTHDSLAYQKFDSVFTDCQQDAEITEKEGLEAATYNGWSAPSSTIDYIFGDSSVDPVTFDVNQEKWNGNFYSDHYAIDSKVEVTYSRELLRTVKSLSFNGDVEVISNDKTNKVNAEVVATFKDGTTEVLPHNYYTIDLPDDYKIGDEIPNVIAKLNGMEDIFASAKPIVKNRMEAERASFTGNSANGVMARQEAIDADGVVKQISKLYTHVGGFENGIKANKESSITWTINSTSNCIVDLQTRAGHDYNGKKNSQYYVKEHTVSNSLDAYVNGKKITLSSDVKMKGTTGFSTSQAAVYHILDTFTIKDIALKEGVNTIKFQMKKFGDNKNVYNNAVCSYNVDYMDVVTKETDVAYESLEIVEGSPTYGNSISTVKVNGKLKDGTTRQLLETEYNLEVVNNASQTKFVTKETTLKATLVSNDEISVTKKVTIPDYCKATKASMYIENNGTEDRMIYELVFNCVGYEDSDFEFFWSAASHIYQFTCEMGESSAIFKFDVTDLTTYSTTNRALVPHLRLTQDNGSVVMYTNGKNKNGDILSTDGSLKYTATTLTLGDKQYKLVNYYDMPTVEIRTVTA